MKTASAQLQQTLQRPRHLRELGQFVGRALMPDDLISVEETESLRVQALSVVRAPSWRCEIPFGDMQSPRFARLVDALQKANPSPIYVWTPLSNVCGLLRPVPLLDVRFNFEFTALPDGILVILTADFQDQMLLDFSEGNHAEQLLEVEVSGAQWGQTKY